MPTQCSADLFGFAPVEGRRIEAAFDGGAVTSDAGALLLGATDRAIKLVGRFAGCFSDGRRSDLIEHEVATLVGQRVFGIALGYEDLNDHDVLRHDPTLAVLAGKLEALFAQGAAVALMAGLRTAGLRVLTPFLAIGRRRLRGRARRLLRPLQAQDQIDQLGLAQTLELVATHPHSD